MIPHQSHISSEGDWEKIKIGCVVNIVKSFTIDQMKDFTLFHFPTDSSDGI